MFERKYPYNTEFCITVFSCVHFFFSCLFSFFTLFNITINNESGRKIKKTEQKYAIKTHDGSATTLFNPQPYLTPSPQLPLTVFHGRMCGCIHANTRVRARFKTSVQV